jgi:peptide/nickel transport system substrate-binding protein
VSRQQVCEIIQAQLAKLGITATPTTVPDLGDALSKGNFDLIDFSWLDIPFPVYNAQSLFDLAGGVDFGSNNDPAMEALLARASTATDPGSVQSLLNQADVALTDDAYNLPLYQRPTLMAAAAEIANIRGNSAQGPPYNAVEWGLRGSS